MKRIIPAIVIAFLAAVFFFGCTITVRIVHETPKPAYSMPFPQYNGPDTTWSKPMAPYHFDTCALAAPRNYLRILDSDGAK